MNMNNIIYELNMNNIIFELNMSRLIIHFLNCVILEY